MEMQTQFLLKYLNGLPLSLLLTVLSYLDSETIQAINRITTSKLELTNSFFRLISFYSFSKKYLTGSDRTIYLQFYGEPAFLEYQAGLMGEISQSEAKKYFTAGDRLEELFNRIDEELSVLDSRAEIVDLLKNLIKDPELPFPKMRREGVAIHCTSSLQFGLADLKFHTMADNFVEGCIDDLQMYLEGMQESFEVRLSDLLAQQHTKQKKIAKGSLLSKMEIVYHHPEQMNLSNYKKYLIPSVASHNLFVYLHVIMSGVAQIYHNYIHDQYREFEKFIEFIIRYNLYRAIVVGLEELGLSRVIYQSMQKCLRKVHALNEQKFESQEVIPETRLEDKKSNEYEKSEQSIKTPSKIVVMNARVFTAGPKIWLTSLHKYNSPQHLNLLKMDSTFSSALGEQQSYQNLQLINSKHCLRLLHKLSSSNLMAKMEQFLELSTVSTAATKNNSSIFGSNLGNSSNQTEGIENIFGPPPSFEDEIFGELVEAQVFEEPINFTQQNNEYINNSSSSSPSSKIGSSNLTDNFSSEKYISPHLTMMLNNKLKIYPYHYEKYIKSCHEGTKYPTELLEKKEDVSSLNDIAYHRMVSKTSVISKMSKLSFYKGLAVSSVEELIEFDVCTQEQLLHEYNSYLIDMSVNEENVHWCGYSDQQLMGNSYANFESYIIKYEKGFLGYLQHLISDVCSKEQSTVKNAEAARLSLHLLNKVLKIQLQYFDSGLIQNVTLSKLFKMCRKVMEQKASELANEQKLEPIMASNEETDRIIFHYNHDVWRIPMNAEANKLEIYEHFCHFKEQQVEQESGAAWKQERKRRNSEKTEAIHNL